MTLWSGKSLEEVKAIRKEIEEGIREERRRLGYEKTPHPKPESGGCAVFDGVY